MGRAVRKVPSEWKHPTDERGGYIPLHSEYMPLWSKEQQTHLQMYENTSEGTPISPVFDTPEALARWLTDNDASFFANKTAAYDLWLFLISTTLDTDTVTE